MAKYAFPTSGNREELYRDVGNAHIASSEIPEITQREHAGRDRDEAEDPPDTLTHLLHFNGTYGDCRFGGGLHQPGLCPLEVA